MASGMKREKASEGLLCDQGKGSLMTYQFEGTKVGVPQLSTLSWGKWMSMSMAKTSDGQYPKPGAKRAPKGL